jgi:hypothetical protein
VKTFYVFMELGVNESYRLPGQNILDLTVKCRLAIFIILFLVQVTHQAKSLEMQASTIKWDRPFDYPDTTIQGVNIRYSYAPSIFPEAWRDAPISASGEKILPGEINRTRSIIGKALKKYPTSVLDDNLRNIYFLKTMTFYNVGYGGTNSTDAVYLTDDGIALGYTDNYIEQTFHHEFSSILFRNYTGSLDTTAWKKANIPGFDYDDPENGVGAIRNNKSSQEIDSLYCRKGFLTQYAQSSIENDVNTVSQNLFLPTKEFWEIADRHPRIQKKISLLISFYNKINAAFTESYFRNFKTH